LRTVFEIRYRIIEGIPAGEFSMDVVCGDREQDDDWGEMIVPIYQVSAKSGKLRRTNWALRLVGSGVRVRQIGRVRVGRGLKLNSQPLCLSEGIDELEDAVGSHDWFGGSLVLLTSADSNRLYVCSESSMKRYMQLES